MRKNLPTGLILATSVAFGLYWNLSESSSAENVTSTISSQAGSSSPGRFEPRESLPDFPRGSLEGRSQGPGLGSAPGWEDRNAKKRRAPAVEAAAEEALHAPDPDDRAYSVSELRMWDAAIEALEDLVD
jgi:hypothetical protein